MNRKNLPLILMLTAGAITCVIAFIRKYTIIEELLSLLIVLVIFYALGSLIKWVLDYFDSQNEKKAQEEGEVIEKEADEEAQAADDQSE